MVEEAGEVVECPVVQNGLGLLVCPGHDVANRSQGGGLDFNFPLILYIYMNSEGVKWQTKIRTDWFIRKSRTDIRGYISAYLLKENKCFAGSDASLTFLPFSEIMTYQTNNQRMRVHKKLHFDSDIFKLR